MNAQPARGRPRRPVCETLCTPGIAVITNLEWNMPGVGRFARIHDPEGNQIELWEPDQPV